MSVPDQPQIPGYEIIRILGINLGVFYLARHSSSGALVCLGIWRLEFASHARELYEPMARLDHPNIIRVLGMGEFEATFFCAREYVGHTLADRLREGPLPDVEVVRIARAIGSALRHAGHRGMVAVSLSPRSIALTDESLPKLTGFSPREAFGNSRDLITPTFMAPECAAGGDPTSEVVQVHRLGALMYEMLTAKPPFKADSPMATVMSLVREMPVAPRAVNAKVGRTLETACMKCLSKRPEARYASLQDLIDHLEHLEST